MLRRQFDAVKILVANVGSTSFKYRLFSMPEETVLAEGRVEQIGDSESSIAHWTPESEVQTRAHVPDYPTAIRNTLDRLVAAGQGTLRDVSELDGVGFKTVHLRGRPGTFLLTDEVLERMAEYNLLAPAHNPPYIEAVRIFRNLYPSIPLVGCFEAAFHTSIPDYAYIYSVPYRWYEKYGIRKRGFHGASHRYVSERVPKLLDRRRQGLRIVSCHLGGSASVCAIRDGRSVDTSMGFSPQDGIINATRNGSIDPFILPFIVDREGLSTREVVQVLCEQSGLLGISGISGHIPDLERARDEGNDRARLAIQAFCYGVKKEVGAMSAVLGGIDALVFTGGIGERGAGIREQICTGLEGLNICLDSDRNRAGKPDCAVSSPESAVEVLIIRTDEERIVAREVASLLQSPDFAPPSS